MGMFANPLGHVGIPPGVTGTPSTQPSDVRAATQAEATSGTLNYVYISPSTLSGGFSSPPAIGGTTPNTGAFTTLSATGNVTISGAGTGVVYNPTVGTVGASPRTVNGRVGVAIFSGVSIAAGATQSFTISNSAITGSTTQILYSMTGVTAGAALSIVSVTNSASQSVVVVTNGTGATTQAANLTFTFQILN